MLAGQIAGTITCLRRPSLQYAMASLLDRRGREMLQIPAIPLCCCWLPDKARDSREGGQPTMPSNSSNFDQDGNDDLWYLQSASRS
jgi:hypothetical protein